MTRKWHKKIALPLVFAFALPILTIYCCCNAEAKEIAPAHHHADTEKHHTHDSEENHSGCNHSSKSSHDHSECKHPQLVADLASKIVSFLISPSPSFKITEHLFSGKSVAISAQDFSTPTGTGPPSFALTAPTPLYLQISVLRI